MRQRQSGNPRLAALLRLWRRPSWSHGGVVVGGHSGTRIEEYENPRIEVWSCGGGVGVGVTMALDRGTMDIVLLSFGHLSSLFNYVGPFLG